MGLHGMNAWLLAATLALVTPVAGSQTLKLGVAQREAVQDVAAALLTEIYRRAGLGLQIEPFPAARLTDMVLKDEVDGEVSRIAIYFERNPSLIRVEPAYYQLVTTAFARADRKLVIASAADLKPYSVGVIRGVYHAAKVTEGLAGVTIVDDVTQLFRMLDAGRIDIAVDVSLNGADVVKQLRLDSLKAVGELARRDLFHVLTPARSALAPKISQVIKSMKASGDLERLARDYERSRLESSVLKRY